MTKNNVQIVEEYLEQIVNQRHFEHLMEYCTEDCILHASPYVGLGVNFDDSSGKTLILTHIAPSGPADGHLQLGDELLRVQDGDHIWETFEDLRKDTWGMGLPHTEIILTVCRQGSIVTIPLHRERIDDLVFKVSDLFTAKNPYWERYWPDLKSEIMEIVGSDDMVACYIINTGTNQEFRRPAIWGELDLFRLKDGRIKDIWGIEDIYSQRRQLGYQILEPVREPA